MRAAQSIPQEIYDGQFFRIIPGSRKRSRNTKFHTVYDSFTLQPKRMNHLSTIDDGLQYLHHFFEELLEFVYSENEVGPQDRAYFVFDHPELYRVRVSNRVTQASELTPNTLINLVQRVMQSGGAWFFFDGLLGVEFAAAHYDSSTGSASRYNNRINFRLRDDIMGRHPKCLVAIRDSRSFDPDRIFCSSRAVAVGIAHHFKMDGYEKIRRSDRQDQHRFASQLRAEAGVPGACGMEEYKRFGELLENQYNLQLLVLDGDGDMNFIYEGPVKRLGRQLCIFISSGHADFCSKPHRILGYTHQCMECGDFHNNNNQHECTRPCYKCDEKFCEPEERYKRQCSQCLRYFYSSTCFTRHQTKHATGKFRSLTICEARRRCPQCKLRFYMDGKSPEENVHTCWGEWCSNCKKTTVPGHLCHMRCGADVIKDMRKRQKGKFKPVLDAVDEVREQPAADPFSSDQMVLAAQRAEGTVTDMRPYRPMIARQGRFRQAKFVFDMETLNTVSKYHVPTYVAVMCLDDDNFEMLFRGARAVEDFIQWIILHVEDSTFICHNASGYDNVFVMRALEHGVFKFNRLQSGTKVKAIFLESSNCRFIDSMSFLPGALSKLPEALGIEHLVRKGFFPYTFYRQETTKWVLYYMVFVTPVG